MGAYKGAYKMASLGPTPRSSDTFSAATLTTVYDVPLSWSPGRCCDTMWEEMTCLRVNPESFIEYMLTTPCADLVSRNNSVWLMGS